MTHLYRRQLLQAAGVSISLPMFSSLRLANASDSAAKDSSENKRRMVCIGNMLGFHPDAYWPQEAVDSTIDGLKIERDFKLGRSSASLDSIRDRLTNRLLSHACDEESNRWIVPKWMQSWPSRNPPTICLQT